MCALVIHVRKLAFALVRVLYINQAREMLRAPERRTASCVPTATTTKTT